MNLDEPEDRDVAAGEYVLGTLTRDERARFDDERSRDPSLEAAVYAWQDRLLDLSRRAPPVEPAAGLWLSIEQRLSGRDDAPTSVGTAANDSVWNRLSTWRAGTGLALAASLLLAAALLMRGPAGRDPDSAGRYVAVLQSPVDRSAGWLVETTSQGDVRLVPIGDPAPAPSGKDLQFWTKPEGAPGPTSLGLVHAGDVAVLPAARLPGVAARQLFEVTLEPAGGSLIGKPTGPILFVGRAVARRG